MLRAVHPGRLTPLPGHGTIYGVLEVRDRWGSVKADGGALFSDAFALHLPGPAGVDGATVTGDGWTLTLLDGWEISDGSREGDSIVVEAGS